MYLLRILAVIWLALGLPLAATASPHAHPCSDPHAMAAQPMSEPAPEAAAPHDHGHHRAHAAGQAIDAGKTNQADHAHHDHAERNCCASHGCCDSGLCARHSCSTSTTLLLPAAQHQHLLAGPVAEHPTAPRQRAPAPGFHATPLRPPA